MNIKVIKKIANKGVRVGLNL